MAEYISREAAVEKLTFLCELREIVCNPDDEFLRGLKNALNAVKSNEIIPSADVQSVDRWISVNDRLPEPEKDVLVWYRYTWGAGFTSYRFGISKWYSNIKRWYEGCLPKDIEVLYWQPLPEPPKGGDTDG